MIELKNDQLLISFPSIADELNRLADAYVERTLPEILAEDRLAALESLMRDSYEFKDAPQDDVDSARERVTTLSNDEIVRAFRQKVMSQTRGDERGHLSVEFQRTLRIPDDGRDYFLPPGLGRFPLRHIDDYGDRVPASWMERGGVMMPIYQSEALWLNFHSSYPFALKVASGKINAVTGEPWRSGLNQAPQDYLVLPRQPWLDGFAVEKGIIRQFVAMPLGAGYSVEEQLSGKAEFGGIQLQVHPLKARIYFVKEVLPKLPKTLAEILPSLLPQLPMSMRWGPSVECCYVKEDGSMGLGAGGRMKQEIYEDPNNLEDWDLETSSRCFGHLCDALVWREITGSNPPHPPATAREYERAGLPWFDFYRDDVAVLEGSKALAGVKSVVQLSKEKGDMAVTGNGSVESKKLLHCGPKQRPEQVREWGGP